MENVGYTFVCVSSKDRNRAHYPSTSKFSVTLPHEIKDVLGVELIDSIIPNLNSVTDEPYLCLVVQELEGSVSSLDNSVGRATSILYLDNELTAGKPFIHVKSRSDGIKLTYNDTVKSSLSKFTINVLTEDGSVFNFGTDNGASPLKTLQTTFVFKVAHRLYKMKTLL